MGLNSLKQAYPWDVPVLIRRTKDLLQCVKVG
jgi:hypothetical protein